MELNLQSFFGLLCAQLYLLAETSQPPPPAFGLIYESAQIDDISLWPPPLNKNKDFGIQAIEKRFGQIMFTNYRVDALNGGYQKQLPFGFFPLTRL
jgi:hypothetical protein